MKKIDGEAKSVRQLMGNVKYSVDYYQREYKWGKKQAVELASDLTSKFLNEYDESHARKKVQEYAPYFLGSIITSEKGAVNAIIDGQQRLTTLTLLLILLHNLQRERDNKVDVSHQIFSESYGDRAFNLDVAEREECINALFTGDDFEVRESHQGSVKNLLDRYHDISESFPEELQGEALPYFIDWLLNNVYLVKISTDSDDHAYAIFETMNDRGLSLTPAEMLKGFLLAEIAPEHRAEVDRQWKKRIDDLARHGKESDADFFKAWLRSQYASEIRERKSGAEPKDFDRIGTEFHRWLREARNEIGLKEADDYVQFVKKDFDFYSAQYLRLLEAADKIVPNWEHVRYNALNGFTLQHMLLLAPLHPNDSEEVIQKKVKITARYIDIMLTWRLWNSRNITYSTMQYAMFLVMKEIRSLSPSNLAQVLGKKLGEENENFDQSGERGQNAVPRLNKRNRKALRRMLARMTDYIEVKSGMASRFEEFVGNEVKYEIEHIWADKFDRHKDEFDNEREFSECRNQFGGLLLLPKSFNASYGDMPYGKKLAEYNSGNLLARSLHSNCYQNNPGFLRFVEDSGLPFQSVKNFTKENFDERGELYRQIAKLVWNPEDLMQES